MSSKADKDPFVAECAEAVAAKNITDELREKAAKLLIDDLRACPDLRISCMCGQCINLTSAELADNLEAKGSEYEEYTGHIISAYATIHRLSAEEAAKPGFFKTIRQKLST